MERWTILIADDNASQTEILKDAFADSHYKVLVAYDGISALEYYHAHHPDAVVLDYEMPGKTGKEVLAEIRATGRDTLVVLITGKDEGLKDVQECLQMGADN